MNRNDWPWNLTEDDWKALLARLANNNPTFVGAVAELRAMSVVERSAEITLDQPSTEEVGELEGALNG